MALANCPSCGALFDKTATQTICLKCMREEERLFLIVRDYLRAHKEASPADIEEATEVPMATIIQFIREGRLNPLRNPNLNFPCEQCGNPITIGNYCKTCSDGIKNSLNTIKEGIQADQKTPEQEKGYFFRDYKRR